METTIRIGVLGAARIAPAALMRPARGVTGVSIDAVAARDRTRAEAFAQRHGIARAHDGYEQLLADPDLDAIYIPLPNGLHGRWTRAAVEAGKHVLCEKPLTANADEARAVQAAVAGSGRTVMEAFHWRYHPLVDAVLDVIGSGEIGEVRHVDAALCAPIPSGSDIRWSLPLAGGSFMDMGCYTVSMARTFGGGEPTVTAARAKERTAGIDRYLQADLTFPSGATGRVTAGMLCARGLDIHCTIVGSAGRIRLLNPVLPHAAGLALVRGRSGRRRLPIRRRATYAFQLEAFRDAVRSGEPPITDLSFAVANMAVIDAAYRAAGLEPREPTAPR